MTKLYDETDCLPHVKPAPLSVWQPIETAPKDGTQFQAWLTDGRTGRNVLQHWEPLCRFNSDGAFEVWGRIDYDMDGWESDWNPEWVATHWMPLPAPPVADAVLREAGE